MVYQGELWAQKLPETPYFTWTRLNLYLDILPAGHHGVNVLPVGHHGVNVLPAAAGHHGVKHE